MFLLKHHLKSPGTRLMLSSADKRLRDVYLRGLPYQESATLMSSPHQGGSETALQTLKWTDLEVASYKISWGSIPGPFERLFEVSVVQRNSDVGTLWEVDFFLAAAKKLYLQFPVAKNGVVAVSEAKRTSLTKNPWRGHSCYIRSCEYCKGRKKERGYITERTESSPRTEIRSSISTFSHAKLSGRKEDGNIVVIFYLHRRCSFATRSRAISSRIG